VVILPRETEWLDFIHQSASSLWGSDAAGYGLSESDCVKTASLHDSYISMKQLKKQFLS
jgi:hypothetical protein